MSDLVPKDIIEAMVGTERQETVHMARASTKVNRVYLLHSAECLKEYGHDLRDCPFSLAMDKGIDTELWEGCLGVPTAVRISDTYGLLPMIHPCE